MFPTRPAQENAKPHSSVPTCHESSARENSIYTTETAQTLTPLHATDADYSSHHIIHAMTADSCSLTTQLRRRRHESCRMAASKTATKRTCVMRRAAVPNEFAPPLFADCSSGESYMKLSRCGFGKSCDVVWRVLEAFVAFEASTTRGERD